MKRWAELLVARLEQNLSVLALPQSATTLANGANNNVALHKGLLIKINGPTAAFNITGLGGGTTGKIVTLYNPTAQAFTIRNDNAGSAAGNRIITMTGADVTLTGPSFVLFVYSIDHWLMLSSMPSSGGGTDTDFYQTVQDEGVPLTQQPSLNFVGAGVTATNDGAGNRTNVTIPATVTSVAETVPVEFTISGSPITTSGTLVIGKATEHANTVWAGPTSGVDAQPTFRQLVAADLVPGTAFFSIYPQDLGTATFSYNTGAMTTSGTPTAVQDSSGHYHSFTTTTSAGSGRGWTTPAAVQVQRQLLPTVVWVFKTGPAATDIQNCTIWLAAFGSTGVHDADTIASTFGFRFRTSLDSSLMAITTNDANTGTSTSSTGTTLVADTRYIVKASWTSTSNIDFFVNNTYTTSLSNTTNMPGNTTGLFVHSQIANDGAGTARTFLIGGYTGNIN